MAAPEPSNALPVVDDDIEARNSIPEKIIEASIAEESEEQEEPPVEEKAAPKRRDKAPGHGRPYTPQMLKGAIASAVKSKREAGFSYGKDDDRASYEWKIDKYTKELAGPYANEVLEFMIGESDFARMDDAEIETLRRYFSTHKNASGKWELEEVVTQEIAAVLNVVKAAEDESDDPEPSEEEPKEESFFLDDISDLSLEDQRKYATKLYRAAKERNLNPPTYTDDTLEWFVVAVEKMLREAGVS